MREKIWWMMKQGQWECIRLLVMAAFFGRCPFQMKDRGVRERRVSALIADGMTRRIRWPHWSSGRPKVSRSDGNASLPIDIDGPVVVKGPQPADTRFCIPGRYQPEKGYICCRSLQVSRCQESNFDFFKRLECSVVSAFLLCALHLEHRTIHTKFRELQRRAQRSNRWRKKEEILLRRRSLVMWKNSMHPSSPSLRRIKLQLIAADAEGGLCLRRANSHTSTRHDQVHLANFPRLSCMFRPYSFKEPFNRSGIPSTWLVSFIHSDTSTSFAIGTRFNSVIHRLHPDGRSALSIWSTKLQK